MENIFWLDYPLILFDKNFITELWPWTTLSTERKINALTRLSIKFKKPIGNGILTCDNMKQAIKRADPKDGNKGAEVAQSAMELLEQFASL